MPTSTSASERSREVRARRKARTQGLWLRKSRVRTTNVDNHGGYILVDVSNIVIAGFRWDLSLDEVEKFLEGGWPALAQA